MYRWWGRRRRDDPDPDAGRQDDHARADEVPAGTVTFKAANKGTIVHALAVLKTDLAHDKIPADAKDASKPQLAGVLRDWGQTQAGQAKDFSAKLEPGSYVLVCTAPAHYIVGMHAGFTVR